MHDNYPIASYFRKAYIYIDIAYLFGIAFYGKSGLGRDRFPPRRKGIDMAIPPDSSEAATLLKALKLKLLNLEQVRHIDHVLASLGEYGEVHLIVQRGELRYINRVESFKVWNSEPKK